MMEEGRHPHFVYNLSPFQHHFLILFLHSHRLAWPYRKEDFSDTRGVFVGGDGDRGGVKDLKCCGGVM